VAELGNFYNNETMKDIGLQPDTFGQTCHLINLSQFSLFIRRVGGKITVEIAFKDSGGARGVKPSASFRDFILLEITILLFY